jgi:hypothetical protein
MMKVSVGIVDLEQLVHWARRYCDGRMTGAPHEFNVILQRIYKQSKALKARDEAVPDVTVKSFPWAQDGSYVDGHPEFNAIPEDER